MPQRIDKFLYLGPVVPTPAPEPPVAHQPKFKDIKAPKAIASYALFGNRLTGADVLYPDHLKLQPFAGSDAQTTDTVQRLDVPTDIVEDNGLLILIKKHDQEPISIQLPPPPKKPSATTAATIKARESIVVGTDEATVTGPGLADVQSVLFGTSSIPFDKLKDDAGVTLALKVW